MRYDFSEIALGGIILPIEGYALIDRDPRDKCRHMPTIVLCGFDPATKKDAEIVLDRAPLTSLMSMNFEIRRWLYDPAGPHFNRMCQQWDDEAPERRLAAQHDAARAYSDNFAGAA